MFYYAHLGEFTAPTKFFFAAPRGVNRTLRRLISKPSEFRQTLIGSWDKYCADAIISGTHIALTPTLRAFIEAWDFSAISSLSVYDLLDDPAGKRAVVKWFGQDPGPPPAGVVPPDVEDRELPYVVHRMRESDPEADPNDDPPLVLSGIIRSSQRESAASWSPSSTGFPAAWSKLRCEVDSPNRNQNVCRRVTRLLGRAGGGGV